MKRLAFLEPFVVWDDELYNYEQEWYRYIEVDFTSFTDGPTI